MIPERKTRKIHVRHLAIGGDAPIAVQSMAATRTRDVEATLRQVRILEAAGADLIRIAVDSKEDVACLADIRKETDALLSVDLQESYKLATLVAPHVDKIRYNPGHLHHHEKDRPIPEKVAFLAETAAEHGCAMRIGVNAGSIAPDYKERFGDDHTGAIAQCAVDHCELLDGVGFRDYVVSIKDSDPRLVIEANQRFAEARPDVPLHLGVQLLHGAHARDASIRAAVSAGAVSSRPARAEHKSREGGRGSPSRPSRWITRASA